MNFILHLVISHVLHVKTRRKNEKFRRVARDHSRSVSSVGLVDGERNGAAGLPAAPFLTSDRNLVPIAVDRPVKAPVEVPVAIAIPAPAITHHRATVHTGRLEPIAEAAGLGGLHERHPSDRRGHYRSKNKPHEDTSSAGYSLVTPERTPGGRQEISSDPRNAGGSVHYPPRRLIDALPPIEHIHGPTTCRG